MFDAKGMKGIAKEAMQGLQKAEKTAGNPAEAAKNALQGVTKAGGLADLAKKAPEPVVEALRKLIAEAKQRLNSSKDRNEALDACIQKAQTALESGDISAESVARLTAELTALMKGAAAGTAKQPAAGSTQASGTAPKAEPGRSAPPVRAQAASGASVPETVRFSDVEAGAYYYDAVQWAVQQGIASGTSETTFSPDQNCTCAQTISFLWRAAGSPAPKSKNNPFTDVAENAFYYNAALWAAERGIVTGTTFNPDAAVTRGQLSAFLYRNAGSPAVDSKVSFTDVPSDAYFCQAVAWVAAQGITSGTGEHTFSPDTICTRGQIVTFLYRAKK